jgi:hypothetical protein
MGAHEPQTLSRWADPSAGRLAAADDLRDPDPAAIFRLTGRDVALAGFLADAGPATATQAALYLTSGTSEWSFKRARRRVKELASWGWLKEMHWVVGDRALGPVLVGPGPLAARRSMAPSWTWEPELVCRSVPGHQLLLRVRHAQQGWWARRAGSGPVVGYLLIGGRQVTLAVLRRGGGEPQALAQDLARRPQKGAIWVLVPTPQELPVAAESCAAAGVLEQSSFTTDANLWHEETPISDAWWVSSEGSLAPARLTALIDQRPVPTASGG